MSFLIHPELRNKHPMMFHSSGFAIAAGVVAVGAAAGSAAISMSASDRANKAQGAAANTFKKQQRRATEGLVQGQQQVQGMIEGVQAPVYNPESMIGDAAKFSAANRAELEKFLKGAAAGRDRQMQLINQAMGVLQEGLQGGYGQDLKENIMRDVAQFAGAGFNPATAGRTGGFQAQQGLVARQLADTARGVQLQSLAALPQVSNVFATWNELAKGFNVQAMDVGRLQLGYQSAQAEVGLQKAKMTSDMFSNIYNAQSGLASQIYGANKENIAASYAAQQAVGQGVSDIGQATSGALSGYANATRQLSAVQGAGGAGGGGYAGGFDYSKVYGPATYGGGGEFSNFNPARG